MNKPYELLWLIAVGSYVAYQFWSHDIPWIVISSLLFIATVALRWNPKED